MMRPDHEGQGKIGNPGWVPACVWLYLDHTERGQTMRSLARKTGCNASTVLRNIRKTEARRDDPLVDAALRRLGRVRRLQTSGSRKPHEELPLMLQQITDERTLKRDATRILRAMLTPGSILAVMPDVKSAVVVRETTEGAPRRIAVVERTVAEAMALKEWIKCTSTGKVLRYVITSAGRAVLSQFLAEAESSRAGFSEAQAPFEARPNAPRMFGDLDPEPGAPRRRARNNGAQTPLQVLGRRRDKNGKPYLSPELIMVSERVRTDFELSWLGPRTAMSWEKLAGGQGSARTQVASGPGRQMDAEKRLRDALRVLGPDLGEVVLITCCQQQGMEAAEARLAMPARSGKYVLRIALNMLLRHYEGVGGTDFDLIY